MLHRTRISIACALSTIPRCDKNLAAVTYPAYPAMRVAPVQSLPRTRKLSVATKTYAQAVDTLGQVVRSLRTAAFVSLSHVFHAMRSADMRKVQRMRGLCDANQSNAIVPVIK